MIKYLLLSFSLLISNMCAIAQHTFISSEQTFEHLGTQLDIYQRADFAIGGGGPCDLLVGSTLTVNNDTVVLEVLYNLVIPALSFSCFDLDTFQTNVNPSFYKLITHASVIHTTNLMLDTSLVDSDTLYNFPATVGNVENENLINIYPNPTAQSFYIKGKKTEDSKRSVLILSASGVLMEQFDSEQDYYEVSHLPPALYIVRIIEGDKIFYRKLMVD